MTRLQKAILSVGALLLLANVLFPPWESPGNVITGWDRKPIDRSFVATPPLRFPETDKFPDEKAQIDWSQLAGTSLAIITATGAPFGATVLFKKPRPS